MSPGPRRAAITARALADAIQGLSAGWADVYQYSLPGQSIDVTGVAPGEYCVVTSVDPAGRLLEVSTINNVSNQRIRIKATGDVARLSTPC